MATATTTYNERNIQRQRRRILTSGVVTMFALAILAVYLMPMGYGLVTSLKTKDQISDVEAPILPARAQIFEYEGEEYEVYNVPTDSGIQQWALAKKGRESSEFLDPSNPEAGLITWEGRWRTLERTRGVAPTWENYPEAFTTVKFLQLLGNTAMYAGVTMIGAVLSAAFVAYGFARF